MKTSKTLNIVIVLILFICITLFLKSSKLNTIKQHTDTLKIETFKNYSIKNTSILPDILEEVSGIVWLSKNTFACIQDEMGHIFIYNTQLNSIIKDIKFADAGDYEDITINNQDAYVLRSDGLIYEILDYHSKNIKISKIKTPFTEKNNMESLTFDKQNNRLLLTPKDKDLGKKQIKSIYQIPIQTKSFDTIPIIEIDLKSKKLETSKSKKIEKTLRPSAIAVHPQTQDIYVLDSKNLKLLLLHSNGEISKTYNLNKHDFSQPEGITFSTNGQLFISNEGNKNNANILEIELE
ncbi:SdiA-regulated domain-containing protein [Winogradskyella sp. Asnod2-B02-A]|uniref:SdiA-regulated domain-containing protein n=1 Tax=Winogradskyella sp. Asnod2-B02-A TaxID=3160583 RepID=UPI003868E170